MTRECGACQVCCELPAVGALDKPMYTPCAHQCAAGCGIYETRPSECRAFECAWLRGDVGASEAERPDRLGLMIETCASELAGAAAIRYVRVWEVRPDALQASEEALLLLASLSESWPIKLYRHGAPPSFGPADADAPAELRAQAEELERRERGDVPRVGRNERCPCGSGRKYKACHGR